MALSATEFLSRFLLHILPGGFVRIRQFGLLANRGRPAKLARCRGALLAAVARVLCEALIALCFVAKEPSARAVSFWDYYTIEAFETARTMVELERGRSKPEHVAAMERWLAERRPEYDRLKPRYTYVVPIGKGKDKSRPYRNWCNCSVADQAKECGEDLNRLYRLVYKQMSAYVHCSAFSLRRQAAYSRAHYDAAVVHRDMATLVRTTAIVWIEVAKFLTDKLGWNLMPHAAAVAEAVERLDEEHFSGRSKA